MTSRLLSLLVWALLLASALFWGLKLFVHGAGLPAGAQLPTRPALQVGELSRLLGAVAEDEGDSNPAGSDRFALLGLVAPKGAAESNQGVALIAVDGQPPKAFRTGSTVADGMVLLSVEKRLARLGPRGGGAAVELSLPDPATQGAAPVAPNGQVNGPRPGGPTGFGMQPGGAVAVPRPGLPVPPGGVPGQPQAAVNNNDDDE